MFSPGKRSPAPVSQGKVSKHLSYLSITFGFAANLYTPGYHQPLWPQAGFECSPLWLAVSELDFSDGTCGAVHLSLVFSDQNLRATARVKWRKAAMSVWHLLLG